MEATLKGKTGKPPLDRGSASQGTAGDGIFHAGGNAGVASAASFAASELRHRKPWGSVDDERGKAVLHSKGNLKPLVEAEHKEAYAPNPDLLGHNASSAISPDRSSASTSPKSFMQSVKESIMGIIPPFYSPLSSNDDEPYQTAPSRKLSDDEKGKDLTEKARREIEETKKNIFSEGQKLFNEGKYSNAEPLALHLVGLDKSYDNLVLLADIYIAQAKYDEFITFAKGYTAQKDDFNSKLLLSIIQRKTQDLFSAKKYSDAEKLAKFLLEVDESIENLTLMVNIFDDLDYSNEVIKYASMIIDQDNNNLDGHRVLTRAFFLIKEYEKSEAECDFLIKLGYNDPTPYYYKGRILLEVRKECEKAIEYFYTTLKFSSITSNIIIYHKIAIAYTKIGDNNHEKGDEAAAKAAFEQALNAYDKIIELNPNDSDILDDKARVLNSLGRHDEAIIACDKALALNPLNYHAINTQGNAYKSLEKYDEAIALYKHAISINSKEEVLYTNWGEILKEQKKYHEAKEKFLQAKNLEGEDKDLCIKLITEVDELIMKEELTQESKKQESETMAAKEIIIKDEVPSLIKQSNELVAMGMKLINEGKFEEGSKLLAQAQEIIAKGVAENSRIKSIVQEQAFGIEKEEKADLETSDSRNKAKISDDENAAFEASGIDEEHGSDYAAAEVLEAPSVLGATDS